MGVTSIAGILAAIIRIGGDLSYIFSVRDGESKPDRISWLIWSILTIKLFVSYALVGARETLWVPFIAMTATCYIFYLAINQHPEKFRWFQRVFTRKNWGQMGFVQKWSVVVGTIGIVSWIVSTDPFFAVISSLIADLAGSFAMLPKTWKNPSSESKRSWIIYISSDFANLFAAEWDLTLAAFKIFVYVASMFLSDGIVLATILVASLRDYRKKEGEKCRKSSWR